MVWVWCGIRVTSSLNIQPGTAEPSELESVGKSKPFVSGPALSVVDPGLVDIQWIGSDTEASVQQDVL